MSNSAVTGDGKRVVEESIRPDETEKERVDRELIELLQELRVALPGVQVLFAFLLILPFSQGAGKLGSGGRAAFITSLLCAAAATALLIAPTSYHRLRFRAGDKKRMLFTSNRLAITGLVFLAVAMASAVFVVLTVLVSTFWAAAGAVGTGLWFGSLWWALPLFRKQSR